MAPLILNYNTLDVFTITPFTGNQLGLVHLPSSPSLSQAQKQQIAVEFNYSETVFLHHKDSSNDDGIYEAQIFTPKSELPFAGHPTIGTAVWVFENLEPRREEIVIRLKAGPVKCRYERGRGVASARIPFDVRVHGKAVGWERVVEVQEGLKWGGTSMGEGSTVPLVSIVKGMNFALVDLSADQKLLDQVKVTKDDILRYEDLDEGWQQEGLLGNVFYYVRPEQDDRVVRIAQRVIVIELEDPATGAASAALTAYLALKRGGAGKNYSFEIDQGVEMGRAGKIFVEVGLNKAGDGVESVELKGQAVEVMKGTLRMQV
ncbi:hypothetical protein LTR05_007185 [Lithohypha guttulata]|uniref:Phenazine biosynthesis protein n=1 Tax=Lithohypha guttulata TaxID=1690604 RepID=A0AAN7Y476_9EURO|nr:hypothetical protein LTR05_007185 [Lithohypha guttulata]